jgi:CHAT domain-containing protein
LQLVDRLLARPPSAARGALAIGVQWHPDRPELPAACAEAAIVAAAHHEADVWCNAEATIARLREASQTGRLARYRLVHLATHAWGHMRAERAGIALADGDLRVAGMAGLHFDAALLVLAACESGMGTVLPGEEGIGLVYAALQAGARALLATLWQVDDDTSLALMGELYRLRQAGYLGPYGLASMQRAAWAAGRPAYDWAGYCWIGTPTEKLPADPAKDIVSDVHASPPLLRLSQARTGE